jgi:two-component system, OmpR family, KDP operon response regulator KdpE
MIDIPILIIDDDINILSTMEHTFMTLNRGFSITTATTANGALATIKEKRPAIVILDVRIGPKSGMDLLKDFSGYFKDPFNKKYEPRYIVITAYQDENIEKEAREIYHVDDFLYKPFKGDTLRRAVALSLEKVLMPYLSLIQTYKNDSGDKK